MNETAAHTPPASGTTDHLEALGHRLTDKGFSARVVSPIAEPPFLRVVNPTASDLAENVTCGQADGELSYLWSWHDLIAPVRHVDSAAERIAYVLTPQGEQD